MSKKKTNEEFIDELYKKNPDIQPLMVYEGSHNKILFRCLKCKKEWEAYPYQELNRSGSGCRLCSYKSSGERRRKSNYVFAEELYKKNPHIELLTQYISNKKKVKCRCKICGNIWSPTPDSLLRGIGCPDCNRSSTSFVELFIFFSLSEVLGKTKVLNRDKKAIGKELDIYIPSLGFALEYGAWYWHKNRINKDKEKQILCAKHNIRLMLIYDACDEINACDGMDYQVYKQNLSMEKSHKTIKQIVVSICDSYNLDYSVLHNKWDDIAKLAYQKSRKLTTEDFIRQLKRQNSHRIEVLGEYKSAYSPIECRCKECGFEWKPRPNNLLNENAGCPRCSGNRRYTKQEYASLVKSINPDFELLEPYTRSNASIRCRCIICGYEWNASAGGLLKRRAGCPKCLGRVKYTDEDFVKRLHEKNPNINTHESYPENNKTKIKCSCKVCGNIFFMRPNNLLSGQGCPKCSREKNSKALIKDNDWFVKELNIVNPNVITLKPYIRSKIKLPCRCRVCGNEWDASPNSLLHGYGCPSCAKQKRTLQNKKRVLCEETNIIYESLDDASIQSGCCKSSISMCCNGKLKSAGGFHWKYVN